MVPFDLPNAISY